MGGARGRTVLLAGGGVAVTLVLLSIFVRGPAVSGTITRADVREAVAVRMSPFTFGRPDEAIGVLPHIRGGVVERSLVGSGMRSMSRCPPLGCAARSPRQEVKPGAADRGPESSLDITA